MKTIPVKLSDKLEAYVNDLIKEEGYGKDEKEVVESLIWRGIEVIMCGGMLTRRPGKYKGKKKPENPLLMFEIHPQLMKYLEFLVRLGLHGNDVNGCAERLISKQMEEIITSGYIPKAVEQLKAMDLWKENK